jgi:hypothetical protein
MIFSNVNLKNELAKQPRHEDETDALLADVKQWLANQSDADADVLKNFPNHAGISFDNPQGNFNLNVNEVYTQGQIKSLCVSYRLRFLPAAFYKGTLPHSAVKAIQAFEGTYKPAKAEYHIVAPAEFFKLKDQYADPLLFANLGNGNYYLLHQWGADFKPYAKALAYPLRNEKSLALSALSIGAVLTLISIATNGLGLLDKYGSGFAFSYLVHSIMFLGLSAFVFIVSLAYGLLTYRDLSVDTWDSKYFN